jgi:hypothetical protein
MITRLGLVDGENEPDFTIGYERFRSLTNCLRNTYTVNAELNTAIRNILDLVDNMGIIIIKGVSGSKAFEQFMVIFTRGRDDGGSRKIRQLDCVHTHARGTTPDQERNMSGSFSRERKFVLLKENHGGGNGGERQSCTVFEADIGWKGNCKASVDFDVLLECSIAGFPTSVYDSGDLRSILCVEADIPFSQ